MEARCVGSNPTNPSAESGYSSYLNSKYQLRDRDTNYAADYDKMGVLGIRKSNSTYWLASRNEETYAYAESFFNVYYTKSSGNSERSELCYIYIIGPTTIGYEDSHGFRPVFTLKSGIKITGGDGSSDSPYTLGI